MVASTTIGDALRQLGDLRFNFVPLLELISQCRAIPGLPNTFRYDGGMISAALPAATRRSSDLSKHSAEVFAEAEDHPVTVTRRDGETLVLMSQREAEGRSSLLNFAARLITVTLDESGSLAARMAKAFPWMLALSPADRETCAQNLVDAARASFSTDQPHLAIAELTSWKETAIAIAAGLGSADLEWLDDNEPVERP